MRSPMWAKEKFPQQSGPIKCEMPLGSLKKPVCIYIRESVKQWKKNDFNFLFIYLWWVFIAARGLSLAVVPRLLIMVASLIAEHKL